jgi:RNA polymerase sigma-70 factor, ECF subfamily
MPLSVMPLPSAASRNDARERQLLQRIAIGDRQAFDELYLSYHRRLARFLLRLAPHYDLAEEVINDTFWVVWQKAAAFRGASQVSTWIMGIAYRRALKTLRSRKAQQAPPQLAEDLVSDPVQADNIATWVSQGLAQLPQEQRMTLELAYYMGHSCEEIGTIMQCPITTVKARLFHARQRLKTLLPQLAGQNAAPAAEQPHA